MAPRVRRIVYRRIIIAHGSLVQGIVPKDLYSPCLRGWKGVRTWNTMAPLGLVRWVCRIEASVFFLGYKHTVEEGRVASKNPH